MTSLAVKHLTFAVPGDLATPTGGYTYDRRVSNELRQQGWQVNAIDIGDAFPRPSAAQLANARDLLAQTPTNVPVVIDGLAFGVMDAAARVLAKTHVLVALVHHPLALETGLSAEDVSQLRESERSALAQARNIITTSPSTADILIADYAVPSIKITVAPPGNDPMPPAIPSTDGICRLLAIGSLVPRKGYDVLIAALEELAGLPWQLTIVGDTTRSPETTEAIKQAMQRAGLSQKIRLTGALSDDELAAAYAQADVFVTASHFEGYGMAVTAAIAHGLPIVATSGGALAQTVGKAGLLVKPGDTAALAAGLRRILIDEPFRTQLRGASIAAAKKLPSWSETAARFATAIEWVL